MSMRRQAGIVLPGYDALKVANAPTIGTATSASGTSVSVAFTAPACVGGGAITSYRAYCTTTGTNIATGASSPLVVTGLTTGTAYTFRVSATNAYGPSYPSAASNSATPVAQGQDAYTTAGSYSWVAPSGVTSVAVVAVGGGASGRTGCGNCYCLAPIGGTGGGGGALAYKNNYSVTPGGSYTVVVGSGGARTTAQLTGNCGNCSYFVSTAVVNGGKGFQGSKFNGGVGGTYTGDGGGNGGGGGGGGSSNVTGAGGGAGGYAGNGGNGASGGNSNVAGSTGSGGGGGGGAKGNCATGIFGAGGGGVGILGQGSSGAGGGTSSCNTGGRGGSGGANGVNSNSSTGVDGGAYGGGGGARPHGYSNPTGNGGVGAVRIIYPGTTRSFPSTNTGNL